MDIERIRTYCLAKPQATEDMAFGPGWLLFRVFGKIFACIDLTRPDRVVVKCQAERALALRERHAGIVPAWHWNKRYWNEVLFDSDVDDDLVLSLIDHSLDEVLARLPLKVRRSYAHT